MSLQYLRNKNRDELDFLHADKHQSFQLLGNQRCLQGDTIITLLGMIKHSQSTQSNKFAIS